LCCYRDVVHDVAASHFPIEEILADIAQLREVGSVYISGGEPTLHPEIDRIMARAREIRGSSHLGLITNGARLLDVAEATKYVDTVRLSIFLDDEVESGVGEKYAGVKPANVELLLERVRHHDYGSGPFPCESILNTLSVMRGRIYPCCVAAGIADAQSTPLAEGWEQRLLSVETPCESCVNGT
jgi:hypothetical protein